MSQVYASNVDRINDQIRSLGAKDFDSKEEMGQQLVADQKASATEKTQEYMDKWKEVSEAGGEDLAGVLGIRGLYKTYQKAKSVYQKYKSASEQQTKPQETTTPQEGEQEIGEDSHIIDAEEEAPEPKELQDFSQPSEEPESLQETRFGEDITDVPQTKPPATSLSTSEPPAETSVQKSIIEQDPESTADLAGEAGETAAETAGETAGETIAAAAGDLGIAEAATAAIPVVGEAAAVIGGLVAIGEGLYHLFHKPHHSAPKPPAPVAPVPTSQLFTSKINAGLPTTDSGVDMAASATLF